MDQVLSQSAVATCAIRASVQLSSQCSFMFSKEIFAATGVLHTGGRLMYQTKRLRLRYSTVVVVFLAAREGCPAPLDVVRSWVPPWPQLAFVGLLKAAGLLHRAT